MSRAEDKDRLAELFPYLREYQKLASRYGIQDVFQDNGGKLLQVLLIADLEALPGRLGNDARDMDGNEFELKSVNIELTQSFSTHHHLNPTILAKYREVEWYFAVYRNIELEEIWKVPPERLEMYFERWEKKWHDSGGRDLNNPKIPVRYVQKHGDLVYKREDPTGLFATEAPAEPYGDD